MRRRYKARFATVKDAQQLALSGARLAVRRHSSQPDPTRNPPRPCGVELRVRPGLEVLTPDKITSFRLHAPRSCSKPNWADSSLRGIVSFHFMFLKEKYSRKRQRILVVREVNGKSGAVEAVRH